ncbi:pleckstrin homology domain-containing family A member 2-like [Dendronephthya gigantea]|uniref:pleckstrin homology domain-containing family A member 2-like n=1 Tax=Dendronephthya gigantea TaxID=151771 RepID=UPI00106B9665|nr:pleckstrin homology domain-containing family A member 2-like [Dendronephthya gigantea]
MPERDSYGRLGGYLEVEEHDYADAWRKRFVLLDDTTLRFYPGKETMQESIKDAPNQTIDLAYITKVAITTNKPTADYCFEIHTASKKWYLKSDSESEIEEWFKALHKAAVNPSRESIGGVERGGSVKSTCSNDSLEDTQSNVSYETKIIGGIPVRTVKTNTGDPDSLPNSRCNSGTSDTIRPIKGGYCIKQGAVVKSWKRRYLRLDMFKFCYYEKETDKEPRGSVSATDLRGAKPYTGAAISNKPHVFEVVTPQRTYYIQAESEEDMLEWVRAFKQVIRSIKGKSTVEASNFIK